MPIDHNRHIMIITIGTITDKIHNRHNRHIMIITIGTIGIIITDIKSIMPVMIIMSMHNMFIAICRIRS